MIVFATLCLALPAARADDLADSLNQDYKNHVLGVRHPIHDGDQEFDAGGNPLNAGATPDWEVYGGIMIYKVSVKDDQLRVEGQRVAPSDRVENGKPVVIFLGKRLNFDIQLDHPLASMDDARKILGNVFYLDPRDVEHLKPELRRTRDSTDNRKVHRDGGKIGDAPKALYTPEPIFSEAARKAKFQGEVKLTIVIDATGTVSDMKIERGLGLGLDEQAFECVKKWRFTPGTRNGEPVAVEFGVGIFFNLF